MEERLTKHAHRWARRMAARLIRRKDRGVTWHDVNCLRIIERARAALDEMEASIDGGDDPDCVADAAADAANLAMMAADSWGLLGKPDEPLDAGRNRLKQISAYGNCSQCKDNALLYTAHPSRLCGMCLKDSRMYGRMRAECNNTPGGCEGCEVCT